MNFRRMIPALLVTSFFLAACGDAQVDPDYQGEALATVKGTVTGKAPAGNGQVDTSLVWLVTSGSPDYTVTTSAPVTGQFPASFKLNVYTPPGTNALNDFTHGGMNPDESKVGFAFIGAVKGGVTEITDDNAEDAILGLAENFILVYVDRDIQPGTFSEKKLHGTLSKGFHLMKVVRLSEELKGARQMCQDTKRDECFTMCESSTDEACPSQCQEGIEAACADECKQAAGNDPEMSAACESIFDQLFEADQKLNTNVEIRLDSVDNLSIPNWT